MKDKAKPCLFIFLLGFLLLPLVQHVLGVYKGLELQGKFTPAPDAELSFKKWWSGDYWVAKSKYLNDAVGFRPVMVSINNQLNFSLFNKKPELNLVEGAHGNLFYWSFVKTYYGKDYIGTARVTNTVKKLKAVQDTLAHLGKSLVLVQAPSKAYFYSEDLPAEYQNVKNLPTNYSDFARIAAAQGINQIDFNAWFMAMKGKSKDALFTKQGIHWSVYGALLGADSMVKYLEKLRHIKMVHPVWTKVERTGTARFSDDEITKLYNLMFPYMTEIYSYPMVSYPEDASMTRLKMVYIGDSYVNLWVNDSVADHIGPGWQFWYYFKTVRNAADRDEAKNNRPLGHDEWIKGVNNADCIVLVYTASNLCDLGSGFIEQAYSHYYPSAQ